MWRKELDTSGGGPHAALSAAGGGRGATGEGGEGGRGRIIEVSSVSFTLELKALPGGRGLTLGQVET